MWWYVYIVLIAVQRALAIFTASQLFSTILGISIASASRARHTGLQQRDAGQAGEGVQRHVRPVRPDEGLRANRLAESVHGGRP